MKRRTYSTKRECEDYNPDAKYIYVFTNGISKSARWAASIRLLKIARSIDLERENGITIVELFHKKPETLRRVFKMR